MAFGLKIFYNKIFIFRIDLCEPISFLCYLGSLYFIRPVYFF